MLAGSAGPGGWYSEESLLKRTRQEEVGNRRRYEEKDCQYKERRQCQYTCLLLLCCTLRYMGEREETEGNG